MQGITPIRVFLGRVKEGATVFARSTRLTWKVLQEGCAHRVALLDRLVVDFRKVVKGHSCTTMQQACAYFTTAREAAQALRQMVTVKLSQPQTHLETQELHILPQCPHCMLQQHSTNRLGSLTLPTGADSQNEH